MLIDGEQQMPRRHMRRRPEREQHAQHQRVTHQPVQQRRLERLHATGGSAQRVDDLAHAEQLEMIDLECRKQRDQPAHPEDRREHRCRPALNAPDGRDDRAPLPEDQDQQSARDQHIGAALAGSRNDARPPALEGRARHDAVLDRKQAKQHRVDQNRVSRGAVRSDVDRLRDKKIAKEGRRVGK